MKHRYTIMVLKMSPIVGHQRHGKIGVFYMPQVYPGHVTTPHNCPSKKLNDKLWNQRKGFVALETLNTQNPIKCIPSIIVTCKNCLFFVILSLFFTNICNSIKWIFIYICYMFINVYSLFVLLVVFLVLFFFFLGGGGIKEDECAYLHTIYLILFFRCLDVNTV